MQKLRWSWALPIIQLAVAVTLVQYSYHAPLPPGVDLSVPPAWTICRGIDAPAILFRTFGHYVIRIGTRSPEEGAPEKILGFYTDDWLFLAGVVLVWYLVGRALQRRWRARETRAAQNVIAALVSYSLQVASGVLLLFMGVHDLQYPNSSYSDAAAFLILSWALILMTTGIKGILPHSRNMLARC